MTTQYRMELYTEIIKESASQFNRDKEIIGKLNEIHLEQYLDVLKNHQYLLLTENRSILHKMEAILKPVYDNDPQKIARAILIAYYFSRYGTDESSELMDKLVYNAKRLVTAIKTNNSDQFTYQLDRFFSYYLIWINKTAIEKNEVYISDLRKTIHGYLYGIQHKLLTATKQDHMVSHMLTLYQTLYSRNKMYLFEGLLLSYTLVYQCPPIKDQLWKDINNEFARSIDQISVIMLAVLRHFLLEWVTNIEIKRMLFYEIDPCKLLEKCNKKILTRTEVGLIVIRIKTMMKTESMWECACRPNDLNMEVRNFSCLYNSYAVWVNKQMAMLRMKQNSI